jgi:hypothetical protein
MTRRPTYPELRERWERVRKAEGAAYRKEKKSRRGRAVETAEALEALFFATGNEVYKQAFEAMRDGGIVEVGDAGAVNSVGGPWKYRPLRERNAEAVYLAGVDDLVRRDVELRHAAAMVAVTYFIPGKTFDAVVAKLEKAYRDFRRSRIKACLSA